MILDSIFLDCPSKVFIILLILRMKTDRHKFSFLHSSPYTENRGLGDFCSNILSRLRPILFIVTSKRARFL